MEPNPRASGSYTVHCGRSTQVTLTASHRPCATPQYNVVVPDLKGGEKRLVLAAPKESCMTKTRQNSPGPGLLRAVVNTLIRSGNKER